MRNFRYNSTRVALGRLGASGVVEADYTGPITEKAFSCLRSEVVGTTSTAHGLVLRLDKCLDLMGVLPPPSAETYKVGSPPGAVIVRADQFDKWVEYNRQVAKLGVMRTVWLESHSHLAYEWILRQSAVRLQELPQ